ncbi:MAG: hypothetical protein R2752_13090 [Vicinamibacterales bacterium]
MATPATIALTDGGVCRIWAQRSDQTDAPLPGGRVLEEPEFLLVSDGGYPPVYQFDTWRIPGLASLALMLRVNAIALEQVSALRRRLTWMFERQQPDGLLVALGSSLDRLPAGEADRYRGLVGDATCPPASVVERIQRVRTHLNRFSRDEAEMLM